MNHFFTHLALLLLPFVSSWFVVGALSAALTSDEYNSTSSSEKSAFMFWRISLSFGVAITFSSLTLWFFLLWPRISSLETALTRVLWTELFLAVVAFSAWFCVRRRARHRVLEVAPVQSTSHHEAENRGLVRNSLGRKLKLAWMFCVLFSVAVFGTASWSRYLGELDAWSIWNLHARFIWRGGAHWPDFFHEALRWSHPDYPLAIPLTVVRGWTVADFESSGVPIALGLFFAVATTGVVMSSLCILRGSNQALLGGILLLGTPFFALNSAAQTADVPLSFYFLGSLVCLALLQRVTRQTEKWALVFLSGILAGGAAWTKNEGSLWVLCLVAILLAHTSLIQSERTLKWRAAKWRTTVMILAIFLLAASPALLGKISIGFFASSEILGSQGTSTWQKLQDISRWKEASISFLITSQTFGLWACPSALFLWYYARSTGLKTKILDQKLWPSRVLPLMCCCLFAVFLATPYPIEWHLANSVNRLLLQMWPCVVFTFFLVVKTPEEILEILES